MSDVPEHLIRPPDTDLLPGLRPLPPLLDISQVNGSPWTNPAFDTSAPDWSSNVVGGQVFDGSAAHKFEWVSVLNPGVEQDDEVGVAGTAVNPNPSGKDLPFDHPFGFLPGDCDWEFTIVPDPAYTNLLAAANKNPNDHTTYGDDWAVAVAAGIPVPTGLLGVEVDGPMVPPAYRVGQGDRVAVYGRWIVDAGHAGFHTEIHPPLLMARAQSVDANGNTTARNAEATTLFQLWSRPYQSGQLYTTGGQSGLPLRDYVEDIAETLGQITATAPLFAKPFEGIHLVAFTVRPPVDIPPPKTTLETVTTPQLEYSYHFTVNGSCGVEVIQSPAEPDAVMVVLALNSVNYPDLPAPPRHAVTVTIEQLLGMAPGAVNLDWIEEIWAKLKGSIVFNVCEPPQMSQTQDQVNVVPFTPISQLPSSSQATDKSQPFPVYGWLKLQWVTPSEAVGSAGRETLTEASPVRDVFNPPA
jgi:hypothetical protein